jgi:hypothetical protein
MFGGKQMKKVLSMVGVLMLLCGIVVATGVNVDMDVDSGQVTITADDDLGTDEESRTYFSGNGGFIGTFNANDENIDSIMSTLVRAGSKGTTSRTRFEFDSSHNLGDRNNNDNKMVFTSWTEGEGVTMDMYLHNTRYQSQAEREDGLPMISAFGYSGYDLGYTMANSKRDDSNTNAFIAVTLDGDGYGQLGKTKWGSNHLARGIGYNQNALDVRDGEAYAEGSGTFEQFGYGENSLKMNGFVLGSGSASFVASYAGGLGGTYSYYGK